MPHQLPKLASASWEVSLGGPGLGGIVADEKYVIAAFRDIEDRRDSYQCFDAQTGKPIWQHLIEAPGSLDYGNAPRATPLVHDGLVYIAGALGDVQCLELETGVLLWQKHLLRDFGGGLPTWGFSASPILVADRLIVQPGGMECSIAALDPVTGDILWQTAGQSAVYASLMKYSANGLEFVVGLDSHGAAAWDANTGKVAWRHVPKVAGDFGVPTPVLSPKGWLLASENNGSRWFALQGNATLPANEPVAVNPRASPDTHTPVVVGDRAYVVDDRVYCLDLTKGLKTVWRLDDRSFRGYASLIAAENSLLACTESGEILLIACGADAGSVTGRLRLAEPGVKCLSHPALVGNKLYIRTGASLRRFDL